VSYTKQTWEDLPAQTTPVNAARLAHIEDGLEAAAVVADAALPASTASATYQAINRPVHYTRVSIIGSSNAAGSVGSPSWAQNLATRLAATHTFSNVAVGGRSPETWVTASGGDATTSPLEDELRASRPHVVIAAFTTQNSGGPSSDFLGWIQKAKAMCEHYGARFVGVTPYISESYTSAQQDANQWLVDELKLSGIPLLNFSEIWGTTGTVPAAIDNGDGLHLNTAGHLEQSRQIPSEYLQLSSSLTQPVFPRTTKKLLIPNDVATASPLITSAFPEGSWTVGFNLTTPSSIGASFALFGFGGSNSSTRGRIPSATTLDVSGGLAHTAQTITTSTEYHVALSYNAVTLESRFWFNGALVSTYTPGLALTFTSLTLGGRPDSAGFNAVGFSFRNLTIHATTLQTYDVARLAAGEIPFASLFFAAALADGSTTRPVGAKFARQFGQNTTLTSNVAIA
jgi:hypothetical protein